jgi:hypothetical protein
MTKSEYVPEKVKGVPITGGNAPTFITLEVIRCAVTSNSLQLWLNGSHDLIRRNEHAGVKD